MEPAIVTIQLGQCGNQVGAACFEGLASQLLAPPSSSTSRSTTGGARVLARPSRRTAFQQRIARRFFREEDVGTGGARRTDPDSSQQADTDSTAEPAPLPRARAVLVDMEPKVIQSALSSAASSRLFRYSGASTFYRQSGSGNNWSYGFGVHGPQCREEMLERVRREVERAPSLGGFVVHQSLAGGTGSGVGAYLTECVHDEYAGAHLINQVVWPYANGEVIVQNYNALLTLAHLNEFSHGILLFENDSLHQICARRLQVRTPTFAHLNRIIAENLTNVLLPAHVTQAQPFYATAPNQDDPMLAGSGGGGGGVGGGCVAPSTTDKRHKSRFLPPSDDDLLGSCAPLSLWSDPLEHLFAHPSFKLSTLRTIPQGSVASKRFQATTWPFLIKYLRQMHLCASDMEDGLDFAVHSESTSVGGTGGSAIFGSPTRHATKRRWHRHWSSSARAVTIYDVNSYLETATMPDTADAATHAAALTSPTRGAASASLAPYPSAAVAAAAQFDTPLPPPAHILAFLDGESYLEYRLRVDAESGDAPGGSATSSTPPPSYNRSLASLLFLRGTGVCSADATSFLDPSLYASHALDPLRVCRSGVSLHDDARLATLWSNSSAVARPLDAMIGRATDMLSARAYVHHYEKYGCDREWMWQQVAAIEQLTTDYRELARTPTAGDEEM